MDVEKSLCSLSNLIKEAMKNVHVAEDNADSEKALPRNVLVHCSSGISRSVTAVSCYLMLEHHMPLLEALMLISSKRPVALPNDTLFRGLCSMECKIFKINKPTASPQDYQTLSLRATSLKPFDVCRKALRDSKWDVQAAYFRLFED